MTRRDYGSGSIYEKDGRWVGQINVAPEGAKRRRKTVYGTSKAEVRRKIGEVRTAIERGDRSTSSPTFEAWLGQWIKRADLRPRTRGAYRSIIDTYLVPTLGNARITGMNAEHVHRLHESMRGLSTTTIRNAHRVASAALTTAQREQRIAHNPFRVIPAPPRADIEQDWLNAAQLEAMAKAIKGVPNEGRWRVALELGLRPGECRGLTWDHVDLTGGVLDNAWQLQEVPYVHADDCEGACGKRPASCPSRKPDLTAGHRYVHVEGNLYRQRPKTTRAPASSISRPAC